MTKFCRVLGGVFFGLLCVCVCVCVCARAKKKKSTFSTHFEVHKIPH